MTDIEAAANAMLALERENARPSHLDYARVAIDAAYPRLVAEIERLSAYLDGQVRYYNEQRQKDLAEIERLNEWADGFSNAQLKERRLCEERIREINAARILDGQRMVKMSDEYEAAQNDVERLRTENARLRDEIDAMKEAEMVAQRFRT
jgi:hypothetical protein